LSIDLVFFDNVLSENRVNRRGAVEEGKREDRLGQRRRNKCLYDRYDRRDVVQRNGHLGDLHAQVRRNAERAIRVGDVSSRMNVNNLNSPADNDQRDAQKREEKPPRTLHLRS